MEHSFEFYSWHELVWFGHVSAFSKGKRNFTHDPFSTLFRFNTTDRPDDDGSFKRRSDYENRREQEPSRSDGDSNWRRGAGTSMGGSRGGYDDRRGGYDDRRGGYDRRGGGGGYNRYDNDREGGFDRRGGYNDNRGGGFDNYDRQGGSRGGYDNNDRGGSGFDSFRRGGFDREPAGDSRGSGGMRPRLQLKSRTAPLPEQPKPVEKKEAPPAEEPKVEAKKEEVAEPSPAKTEEKAPVETTTTESGGDGWEKVEGVKGKSTKETPAGKPEEKETKEKEERKPSKKREPKVVNSRAAMLDAAPDVKRDVSGLFAAGLQFFRFFS